MASESRARDAGHDDDDRGAGGKILPARRSFSPAAASPYSRPVETASAESSPRRSRGWFTGIVSGAGKLISSVFRSKEDGSSCSSSESSEIRIYGDSDDTGEDINAKSYENGEVESSKNLQLMEDPRGDCQPIAFISERKLAIERLLQQETFTRDEGQRLIEIIQSRITDSLGIEDKWGTRLLEFPAVMEAKKWVQQKRSESTSKVDLSFQRALSADLLCPDNECDKESPVNMAKSYMQSLPTWESPLARSSGLKTVSGLYESPYTFGSSSRPSVTSTKRDSLAAGLWDAVDQTRNVRQITSEESSRKLGSCDNMLDRDLQTLIASGRTPELAIQDSHLSPGKNSLEPLAKIPLDNGFCNRTDNSFCKSAILSPKDFSGGRGDEPIGGAFTLESGSTTPDKEIPIASEHPESEIIALSEEHGCDVVPTRTGVLNFLPVDNKGLVDNFADAEPIAMEPQNANLELPSPAGNLLLEKNREIESTRFEGSEAASNADIRYPENHEERLKETMPHTIQFTSNGGLCPSSSSIGSEKVDLSPQTLDVDNHNSVGVSNGDSNNKLNDFHELSPKVASGRRYTRSRNVRKVHDESAIRVGKEVQKEAPTTGSPKNQGRAHGRVRGEGKQAVLRPRRSRMVKQ